MRSIHFRIKYLACQFLIVRNQQYERDSDGIAPLGAGYDGDNFPLRKTG